MRSWTTIMTAPTITTRADTKQRRDDEAPQIERSAGLRVLATATRGGRDRRRHRQRRVAVPNVVHHHPFAVLLGPADDVLAGVCGGRFRRAPRARGGAGGEQRGSHP